LFAGNRSPGFKSRMQAKDLNIVIESAREFGVSLPSLALDSQLFNAMVAQGLGDLDNSAVIHLIEQLADIHLAEG
jgi:2-hydroxy-3-oxopropionate reductase